MSNKFRIWTLGKLKNKHLCLALCCVFLWGCGLQPGDEKEHPLFKKGVRAAKAEEYDLAASYFKKLLKVNWDYPRTHLKLACLYDEQLQKPLLAYYHYGEFIELQPKTIESRDVRKWQEAALRKFYKKIYRHYNDSNDVNNLNKKLEKSTADNKLISQKYKQLQGFAVALKKHLSLLRTEKTDLQTKVMQLENQLCLQEKRNNALKKKLAVPAKNAGKAQVAQANSKLTPAEDKKARVESQEKSAVITEEKPSLELAPHKQSSENSIRIESPLSMERPVVAKTTEYELPPNNDESTATSTSPRYETQSYIIKNGDTLSKIAQRFYGSSVFYKLIFTANRDILKTETSLRPGQKIVIPPLQTKGSDKSDLKNKQS